MKHRENLFVDRDRINGSKYMKGAGNTEVRPENNGRTMTGVTPPSTLKDGPSRYLITVNHKLCYCVS